MTLRRRLGLTVLLIAVPLAAGLVAFWRADSRRGLEENTREFALGAMQTGGRMLCEAMPEQFPGTPGAPPMVIPDSVYIGNERRPLPEGFVEELIKQLPPQIEGRIGAFTESGAAIEMGALGSAPPLWAYGVDFVSRNPRAPAFPAALRVAFEAGSELASETFDAEGVPSIRVAARMPWSTGPCAIVTIERPIPEHMRQLSTLMLALIGLCAALLIGVVLAAGPIVARISRLEAGVRSSASTLYETPVGIQGTDEIAQLGTAFNEAGAAIRAQMQAVQAREQALRRFVADTTHDVMIPLTVLQGNLASIRDDTASGVPAESAEVASGLAEAHYIGSLLHNLGAASALEGARPAVLREPLVLDDVLQRVITRHRPFAASREVSLVHATPEAPIWVQGDITLIEQAVSNVVHNAIRYNAPEGHVSATLDRTPEGFVLRVSDDGPGVPAEQLARLTERRYRSNEARTRDTAGTGLGLHITNEVATRMGFQLAFAPAEGGGLEATLTGARIDAPPTEVGTPDVRTHQ